MGIVSVAYQPLAIAGCLLLAALSGCLLLRQLRLAREIRHLAAQLLGAAPLAASSSPLAQLRAAAKAVEERWGALNERHDQRHSTTGLPTRERLLARMAEDGLGTLGVIGFVDFDRLCAFDPDMADRALMQFAARIVRMIGSERIFAHVDRSHFAIWFGPDVSAAEAEAQLVAITYALSDILSDEGFEIVPEARVHHATFSARSEAPPQVLMRLLAACGSSSRGPAHVVRVDAQSADLERDRYRLEQDLRGAIANDELVLRFQPQVDAALGRVVGAEALLRWNSAEHGMVSPEVFIPLLESAQLIDEVGLWALNAACREARIWQAAQAGSLTVAVNVSSYQLDRSDIDKRIERTLDAQGLAPQHLEIELTESAAAADVARVARLFDSLRSRGIRVAIDDFGTGFSSLSALRAVTFDKIKIDREFVTDVESRRDSQAICQSIIALSRGLGIRVLAEGVERHEEYAWLRKHGCHEFQGFYFSKPLTSSEFQSFVGRREELSDKLSLDPHSLQRTIAKRLA